MPTKEKGNLPGNSLKNKSSSHYTNPFSTSIVFGNKVPKTSRGKNSSMSFDPIANKYAVSRAKSPVECLSESKSTQHFKMIPETFQNNWNLNGSGSRDFQYAPKSINFSETPKFCNSNSEDNPWMSNKGGIFKNSSINTFK